jgi:NarL family two-component system sensor histidine kinase YdfH
MENKRFNLKTIYRENPEIWFFLFATMTFVVMYVWTLLINPLLLTPVWFIGFTLLTILHIAIHWSLFIIEKYPQVTWVYIVVQGGLAFLITLISQNVGMILCLYMALIGETLGIFKRKIWITISFTYILVLAFVNYALLYGIDQIGWTMLGVLPILIFVVLYVSQYNRVVDAREEAKNLLTELEVANRQLSEYTTQVEDLTLANERQRMARELHDTLAQGLAGLILQLEAADSHIGAAHPEKAQSIIQQAMIRARTTLADARKAIGDLRSPPSTPADLVDAIRDEANRFTHTTNIPCKLDLYQPEFVSPQVSENALRAVSEGLLNIAKHTNATEAAIRMTCMERTLYIEITDNGVGFDPKESVGRSGHYGLLGIRERARILGGALIIESQPGQGTSVKIELPLSFESIKASEK